MGNGFEQIDWLAQEDEQDFLEAIRQYEAELASSSEEPLDETNLANNFYWTSFEDEFDEFDKENEKPPTSDNELLGWEDEIESGMSDN